MENHCAGGCNTFTNDGFDIVEFVLTFVYNVVVLMKIFA